MSSAGSRSSRLTKPIAVWLSSSLENGEVIRVEQHRHVLALRSIGSAYGGTQLADFRKDRISLETAFNLIEPRNAAPFLICQHGRLVGGVEFLKLGNSIR